jgi:putative ABC transport system permease protein
MWRITLRSVAARRRRLLATGLAALLGVAFLAGTLVLSRTLIDGFANVIADANKGTDALVRSSLELGREEITERGLIDRSLADAIAAVDGVAAVAPRIEHNGRIVGADGDPIGGGAPTIAGNWVTDARLNPYDLAEGRAPSAPGEVVIDKAAAEDGQLTVGDSTTVRSPDRVEVTIVGLATFGGADSQGSATYAGFTTEFADQVLTPEPGKASSIAVAAAPGVSQAALVGRLDAVLPDGAGTRRIAGPGAALGHRRGAGRGPAGLGGRHRRRHGAGVGPARSHGRHRPDHPGLPPGPRRQRGRGRPRRRRGRHAGGEPGSGGPGLPRRPAGRAA